MKKIFSPTTVTIAFMLLVIFKIIQLFGVFTKIEKGQVWIYELKRENPFEEASFKTNTVLDYKSGYVKFFDGRNEKVQEKRFFLLGSKEIKNVK